MEKLIQESYEQFLGDNNINEAVTIKVSLRYAREAGELFTDMGGSRIGKAEATDVWKFKNWDDAAGFVTTLIVTKKIPSSEISSDNKNIRREYGVSEAKINEEKVSHDNEAYVTKASKPDYVNDVTFDEYLKPLAIHLDEYFDRDMGDLEYSKETMTTFKKLVDLMVKDHKEAENYQ